MEDGMLLILNIITCLKSQLREDQWFQVAVLWQRVWTWSRSSHAANNITEEIKEHHDVFGKSVRTMHNQGPVCRWGTPLVVGQLSSTKKGLVSYTWPTALRLPYPAPSWLGAEYSWKSLWNSFQTQQAYTTGMCLSASVCRCVNMLSQQTGANWTSSAREWEQHSSGVTVCLQALVTQVE